MMKKYIVLRTAALFTAVGLLFCTLFPGASAETPTDYGTPVTDTAVLSDGGMLLEISSDGRLRLTDQSNQYVWLSNPADVYDDPISFGVNQQRVASQMLITYLGTTIVSETASFAQCAAEDGSYVSVYTANGQIICVYHFVGLGFEIPVRYALKDRRLTVTVVTKEVRETGENRLIDFSVNPFFGAGTMEEEGFILIPDGSGAIIDFNNGKTADNRLTLEVLYGNRSAVPEKRQPSVQPVLLPAFGICHTLETGNATVLGFATSGTAGGTVTANVAGRETGFNYAYYTFMFRESAVETMLDRTWASKTRLVVSEDPVSEEQFALCYVFGDPEKSGISEMAAACRGLIFGEDTNGSQKELPVYLDFVMGVRVKQNFLGILYRTLQPLTTVAQAREISEELAEQGIPRQEIRMLGLSNDGILPGKINSRLQISRKIGTVKELSRLAETDGVAVYPSVNLTEYTRSGNGASTFFSASLDLLLDTIKRPTFLLASGQENAEIAAYYLLKPGKVQAMADRLADDLAAKGVTGVSLTDLVQGSYSSYNRRSESDIAATADILQSAVQRLSEAGDVMLDAPTFDYWSYADSILYLPEQSSGYNLCDRAVPFLQMLLSGRVPFSGTAVNFSGNTTEAILNCVRSGSAPSYRLFAADYSQVRHTDARDLYAAGYAGCRDDLLRGFDTVRDALSSVYGYTMIDFSEPQAGVTRSVYSNGTTVLVNTTDSDALVDGVTVEAYSYATAEQGATE